MTKLIAFTTTLGTCVEGAELSSLLDELAAVWVSDSSPSVRAKLDWLLLMDHGLRHPFHGVCPDCHSCHRPRC